MRKYPPCTNTCFVGTWGNTSLNTRAIHIYMLVLAGINTYPTLVQTSVCRYLILKYPPVPIVWDVSESNNCWFRVTGKNSKIKEPLGLGIWKVAESRELLVPSTWKCSKSKNRRARVFEKFQNPTQIQLWHPSWYSSRGFGEISDTRPHLWYKPQILSELWGSLSIHQAFHLRARRDWEKHQLKMLSKQKFSLEWQF
jgi:hypothetical protein